MSYGSCPVWANDWGVHWQAKTVYGALRGLEVFFFSSLRIYTCSHWSFYSRFWWQIDIQYWHTKGVRILPVQMPAPDVRKWWSQWEVVAYYYYFPCIMLVAVQYFGVWRTHLGMHRVHVVLATWEADAIYECFILFMFLLQRKAAILILWVFLLV